MSDNLISSDLMSQIISLIGREDLELICEFSDDEKSGTVKLSLIAPLSDIPEGVASQIKSARNGISH